MTTDAFNEEFILAEEEYEDIKAEIKKEIQRVETIGNSDRMDELVERFQSAVVRFKNATIDLTRIELQNAKVIVRESVQHRSGSVNVPYSSQFSNCMRTEQGRLEIDLARERANTEKIESIVKEIESLNAEVDSAKLEVDKLQETLDTLREEGNDVGTVRHSITEKLDSIEANKNILKELEVDVEKLAAEFEANQPDRLRRIEEKEELMKRLEQNRAMTAKLNDEIFLLESDLWKSRQNMEMVKRAISVTEEEIEEVKNFSIPMEEVASREERRNVLQDLDEEKNRLLFDIESLRDAKFRARMRL